MYSLGPLADFMRVDNKVDGLYSVHLKDHRPTARVDKRHGYQDSGDRPRSVPILRPSRLTVWAGPTLVQLKFSLAQQAV